MKYIEADKQDVIPGQLFLDLAEAALGRGRELRAAEPEIAQRVLDDALARRRKRDEARRGGKRAVALVQALVVPQLGPELRELGLVLVVGGAQLGTVEDGVQMRYLAPGAREALGGVLERLDEGVPLGRRLPSAGKCSTATKNYRSRTAAMPIPGSASRCAWPPS